MTRQYFGTDGIRDRVGQGCVNPEFMLKLGWAVGRVLGGGEGGKVLIGKDTRISGYMFESALEAGLVAAGVDVYLLGPMPTPGIAYLTRTLHANAGIVISASHNSYQDNGIKFFSSGGGKLSDAVERQIEAMLANPLQCVRSENLGKAQHMEDARGRYIEFCKASIKSRIDLKGVKIVVDCAHGAAYHIAPAVFREIGAEVIPIGNTPNGLNINHQVGATHTETLSQTVLEHEADLGIALDGDGDRLMLVDAQGQVHDGDDILYILAKSRQRENKLSGHVVGTVMTNIGLEIALREAHIQLARAKVGDRYVLEKLLAENWKIGGEPSGHVICLDRTTTGDGIVSALQVLAEMHATQKSLTELCQGLEKAPQKLINVQLPSLEIAPGIMASAEVQAAVGEAENQLGNNGRVLLRPSGTEALVRVMVEGQNAAEVNLLAEQIADAVRSAKNAV